MKCLIRLHQRLLRPIVWDTEAPAILEAIGEGSGAGSAVLWRRDLQAPGVRLTAQGAWNREVDVGSEEDLTDSAIVNPLEANEEIRVDSIAPDDRPEIMNPWAAGTVFFPLLSKEWLLGVLAIEFEPAPAGESREVRDFLRIAVNSMALAIERSVYYRLLRDSQERFRQIQKMEAIGQLVGGMAHDFNNKLTIIEGWADMLLSRMPEGSEDRQMVAEILEAATRAASLTKELLDFTRPRGFDARPLEVNTLLRGLWSMLTPLLGETVDLRIREADEPLWIRGDSNRIEEVIINLAINARDAMPHGGKVEVSAFKKQLVWRGEGLPKEMPNGDYLCIEVSDTGKGMTKDIRDRVFDPFFTTKEVGEGTGLGLTTAFAAVRQHEGWINLESEPGKGTVFRLFFSLISEDEQPVTVPGDEAAPEAPAPSARAGDGAILLVEDEKVVREMTQVILEAKGFRVISAANGPEALEVWAREGNGVDLLVTDLVMPENISGVDLARRMREEKPELKVVYISGYSPEIDGLECRDAETVFVPKPFTGEILAKTVRAVLDAG